MTNDEWRLEGAPTELPEVPPQAAPTEVMPAPEMPLVPPPWAPPQMPPPGPMRRSVRNWLGVASLITGVLGMVVLSVVFGIYGLVAYRKGEANTRSLAIAGLAASGAWVLGIGALVIGVALSSGSDISISQASVGDCFANDPSQMEDFAEDFYHFEQCSDSTNGIVYFLTALPSDVAYNDPSLVDQLTAACSTATAVEDIDTTIAADYYLEYFIGPERAWEDGDHLVVCGLAAQGTLDYDAVPAIEPNWAQD